MKMKPLHERLSQCHVFALLAVATIAIPAPANDWARFRGPNGAGGSDAANIPTEFTEKDYNWKVELPHYGHSSPVIWKDKIFLTSASLETGDVVISCLSTKDGSTLWEKELPGLVYHLHARNSFASGSPAVDADHVYVAWVSTDDGLSLAALTHEGEMIWQKSLGEFVSQHGFGASPMVYEDKVILGNDQDGESFLTAFDRKTGDQVWQVPRRSARTAYCTPCVYRNADGSEQLIFTSHAHGISGHDPDTGKTLWEVEVFDKRSVASPIVVGDLVIGSCGSGGGGIYVVAMRPGDGKDKQPEEAYRLTRGMNYVPTPVAHGDTVFYWSDKGTLTAADGEAGRIYWQERVGGNYSGSPVRVGEHLYAIDETGDVVVIHATTDDFAIVSRNPLGSPSRATPAVADGRMYLRTVDSLVSIGGE